MHFKEEFHYFLRDRMTEEMILSKTDPKELVDEFQFQPKLIPSLICVLRDVLEAQGSYTAKLVEFVSVLVRVFERIVENARLSPSIF